MTLYRNSKQEIFILTVLLVILAVPLFAAGEQTDGEEPIQFGVIGMGGGAFDTLRSCENDLPVRMSQVTLDAFDRTPLPDLSVYDIVLVSFASSDRRDQYKKTLANAASRNPELGVFCVGPAPICHMWQEWAGPGVVTFDPTIAGYYGLSKESMRNMVRYILATRFNRGKLPPEPNPGQAVAIHHPDFGALASINDFLQAAKTTGRDIENAPRVVIGSWRHHLVFHQPRVIEALIRELEKSGILPVCLVADSPGFRKRLVEFKPDLVIQTSHTREPAEFWKKLGVPRIHALWFMEESIAEWRKSGNTGMSKSSIQHQILSAEVRGATECLTSGGTESGGNSGEEILPIPDRIRRIAGRAEAWINLARKDNADKKIPLIVYDLEADKAGMMSGPAHALNAPRSMVKLLTAMKDAGYDIQALPVDARELLTWLAERGRQMGSWEPGPLDRMARNNEAVLIPEETYRAWFEEIVPAWRRDEVVSQWGPVPGDIMVWENQGKKYIVVPRINLGNVILVTQPLKGEVVTASMEIDPDESLLPPPHNYLATYFWMQREFGADAIVHFGTHGTEWLFPGKQAVLSGADWSDLLIGNMPNLNPWLSDNTAELVPCKRRARAVTVNFLPPPLTEAGLSDDLLNLESTIDKWIALDDGALKKKFANSITRQVGVYQLDRDLSLQVAGDHPLVEEEISRVSKYLHDLRNQYIPAEMHVLGEVPSLDRRIPYLAHCTGKRLRTAARPLFEIPDTVNEDDFLKNKAEELVGLVLRDSLSPDEAVRATDAIVPAEGLPQAVLEELEMVIEMNNGLGRTHMEIDNLLRGLEGKFVPPGPSGSPERNPGVVPTGRNMFVLNPEELPTRSSWELASKLIDEYLADMLKDKGEYPRKVGFSLVPYATYNDYGIIESQVLYLMGIRPVWDTKNRVRDVELIPAAELNRPRIDVFLSARSVYRDELPSLMKLLDKAIRLAASLDEPDNYVRENSLLTRSKLEQKGMPTPTAEILSQARMYGAKPEEIIDSHNWFFYLTERSGEWETREDLLDVYLSHSKHVYTEGMWGVKSPEAFDAAIAGTETILRSWYDNRDFVLSNKFAWWVDGSLSLAIKHITGKEPELKFVDVRNTDEAKMVKARDVVQQDFRVRLTNPKWISGMMKEGYAGGNIIARATDNLMGWEIMREASIADSNWDELADVYVRDRHGLGVREWFDTQNPHAFQKLSVTMLETIRKGYWDAGKAATHEIVTAYAESVARHGRNSGVREGGNEKLEQFVENTLDEIGTDQAKELLEKFRQRSTEMKAPDVTATAAAESVAGRKLAATTDAPEPDVRLWSLRVVIGIALALFLILTAGFLWGTVRSSIKQEDKR